MSDYEEDWSELVKENAMMRAALERIRTQVNFDITRGGGLFSDDDLAAIDNAIRGRT
jgi:hypothetical protein